MNYLAECLAMEHPVCCSICFVKMLSSTKYQHHLVMQNHNNGSDEGDDDDDNDDDQHNNEINDLNNIDYNDVDVEANNDVAMAASTNVVHDTEDPPYVDYVRNQEEGEADFHNAEEDMNITQTSHHYHSTQLLNNNNNDKKSVNSNSKDLHKKRVCNLIAPIEPKDAVTKAYLLRKNDVLTDSVNNLTTTDTSKMERVEDDMKQFQNTYDLQMNDMKKQIDELYTTIKNDINSEAKQIEIGLKNQLINANKSYMNKIEERFDKIEEYIFKWIGVEQLEEKFDKQLNSMKVIGNPISFTITTPNVDLNSKTVEFNLTLPNDDVLKINISFVMMKVSEALETKDNDILLRDQGDDTTLTTSTTISPPVETPITQQEKEQEKTTEQTSLKYFSVDDAIEAFRRSLINSEMDIGGILEAEKPFYRHFNLKCENVNVSIRCTYKSIYEIRQLKINCFEYREFEQERILSNGEIEKVDLKDYTQMYKKNIM
uniref:Uncharacterized protein n=1 Tax=Glossina austeni TaxID=7395 RepID=A0A1A9VFP0_GLOAU